MDVDWKVALDNAMRATKGKSIAVREFGWFNHKNKPKMAVYTFRQPDNFNPADDSYSMYIEADNQEDMAIKSLLHMATIKEGRDVELADVKTSRARPIWPATEGQKKITISVK